jgi:N-acetyl-gamma-glutamyl-phosphate reductase
MGTRVAVVGASGYAGGELLRLLAGHPHLDVVAATAHENAGQRLGDVHPGLRSVADLVLGETSPRSVADAELVFLALPHGVSGAFAASVPAGIKIVDLGADHRLTDAAAYQRYYGGKHPGAWTYGLPELPGQRARIVAAERVANTGCYAVATILALAPLIAAGVVEPADVVVVATSGTSGAGRSAKLNLLASEVMGDVTPYKVGTHQHVPEMLQASGAATLSFTPLLAPMPRGILAAVTARPVGDAALAARSTLADAYADEPFVHVLPEGQQPHTAATAGSNSAHLQAAVDLSSGRVIVTTAIDNLGKGAAGQAVQNANLMLGLPETAGLSVDGMAP